jgi:hypothetical protein
MNEVDLHEEDENEPSSSTTEQPPQSRAYTHTHTHQVFYSEINETEANKIKMTCPFITTHTLIAHVLPSLNM